MKIFRRSIFLVGATVFTLMASGSAWASSKFLNVQGKLTDTSGNPLAGTQTVTFRRDGK